MRIFKSFDGITEDTAGFETMEFTWQEAIPLERMLKCVREGIEGSGKPFASVYYEGGYAEGKTPLLQIVVLPEE